jgi:phosphoesterase RecJ-like protein
MTKSDATKIARLLKGANRLLITAHRDPDGDSIGCQLAFYEYWTRQQMKKADVVNHGVLPRKYDSLDPKRLIKNPNQIKRRPKWDAAIVFECSSLDRIGSVQSLISPGLPIINIDHHDHNTGFGTVNVQDKRAAACGEMVYDLFLHWKAKITESMARQLAAAVLTDTGRFHYRSTSPRTLELMADLVRRGADLAHLTDEIYYSYPKSHYRLMQFVLGNAKMLSGGRTCFLMLREADRKRFGVPLRELEGLVDYTLYLRGVRVGALLKEIGKRKTKVSLRSSDSSDVAEIARKFGGGGHPNASGCLIELPFDDAVKALAKTIRNHTRAPKTSHAR